MHTASTYIGRSQGKVAQWVTLHLIFEVYTYDKCFEGGRWRRRLWWQQEALGEVLRTTLSEASQEARLSQIQWDPRGSTENGGGEGVDGDGWRPGGWRIPKERHVDV